MTTRILPTIAAAALALSVASGAGRKPAPTDGLAAETAVADTTAVFADDGNFADLADVVVTATRTPKSLKDVPVVTRLITADEIKKTDATNIQDLLTEELPGLEFGYAMSQETSLNMSGFGGSAVLFLVDGERLAGETMDNVDYSRLNLDNVGRVEVVKGAASALYGANAVGGVVNLISAERTEPWHVNINSRYRSFGDEWRIGGDVSFNTGNWNSNTTMQYTRSGTVDLTDAFDTESKIHQVFGGRTVNVKERLTFQPVQSLRLIGRGSWFDRVSHRANYDDHYYDWAAGLKAVWDIADTDNLEVSYGFDRYDKARYVGGVRTHDHDYTNRQHTVHALYSHFFGANTLTVGADYLNDYLTTYQFADNADHSQYSLDAFAQFDYNPLRWLNIVASARQDYFSGAKTGALTGRLALMFKPKPMTVRASYSGGFRAPTLKEMYMDFDMAGIQMIYGNPDLKPERSHNFNLSLGRNGAVRGAFGGAYSFTASGYLNLYDRRITTTDFPGTPDREEGAIYTNEKGVKVGGADVTARYRFRCGAGVKASYNYMHAWGHTVDSQFSQPRPHSATWRLDYEREFGRYYRLYAAVSGRYLSRPQTDLQSDGAYSLWKFTLAQRVWRGVNVNLIVDNIFNYRPEVYYWNSAPTDGTSFSVGVSLDINEMFGK